MTEIEALRIIINNGHELGRVLVDNVGLKQEDKAKVEQLVREIIASGYDRLNQVDNGPPKTDLKSLM